MEMSSSTTSSIDFTTDTRNGLPSYSEAVASVPFLDDTFPSSIFAGATILRFEYDRSYNLGYSFLIPNSLGCLQAQGVVDENCNTKLRNVNGTGMLKITNRNKANEPQVQTFEICHENRTIGIVRVAKNGSASTCLRIIHNSAFSQICSRSIKIGDFSIYRSNSMFSPICNIQMPIADTYNVAEYDGTIIFHRERGINTEEQLLCTAAAIVFKVAMKRQTTIDNGADKTCFYILGIFVGTLVIFALILWACHFFYRYVN